MKWHRQHAATVWYPLPRGRSRGAVPVCDSPDSAFPMQLPPVIIIYQTLHCVSKKKDFNLILMKEYSFVSLMPEGNQSPKSSLYPKVITEHLTPNWLMYNIHHLSSNLLCSL